MKLVVLLLFACQLASANGFSQNITFSGKDVPLEKVFAAIKSQSGHVFFFDAGLLRNARPVSINVSNAPVAKAQPRWNSALLDGWRGPRVAPSNGQDSPARARRPSPGVAGVRGGLGDLTELGACYYFSREYS